MKNPTQLFSTATRQLLTIAAAIALLSSIGVPLASAQFHRADGDKVVRTPVAPLATRSSSQSGYSAARHPNETISQHKFRTRTGGITDVSWNYNKMIDKSDVVWGQAKNHPNGNYTISKVENATLVQRTFSQPRTPEEHEKTDDERRPIERRVVQLDANGRPLEVLIYDIRNQLKFRGQLVYDRSGHFREERLFSPAGKLVRTRIQEYDSKGKPKAVKTVIDETLVDSDISLVLTGNESPGTMQPQQSAASDNGAPKKSLLRRMWPFGKK